jgi:hypothetical protein
MQMPSAFAAATITRTASPSGASSSIPEVCAVPATTPMAATPSSRHGHGSTVNA